MLTDATWNKFYQGVSAQSVRNGKASIRAPQIDAIDPKQLISTYQGGEHDGKTLFHAVVEGALPWEIKSTLIQNMLESLERRLHPEEIADLLQKQATETGNTVMHALYEAQGKARPLDQGYIDEAIKKIAGRVPSLQEIPNKDGSIPGALVSNVLTPGVVKAVEEKVVSV